MVSSLLAFEIESDSIRATEMRLNASSFSPDAANSLATIERMKRNGVTVDSIANVVKKCFYPPRFKRLYSKEGTKFLSSKDIFDFLQVGKRIRNASEDYFVYPEWVLITRSGSVGRVTIANDLMRNVAVSEHVIRVVPSEDTPLGYLYAFLVSRIGQPLIMKSIFGGVIDEIEPHHIEEMPIPRVPRLEKEINRRVLEVFRLREEARQLLLEANERFLSRLRLPEINEVDAKYLGEKGRIAKAFETNANELTLRLDASHHIPLFHLAIQNLKEGKEGTLVKLGNIADMFVPPRFKRIYVGDRSDGIPMLHGAHIPQINPQGVKFIWKNMENLESYIIRKNWILVTCSGTIGRLSLVRDYWDVWSATNHLLRIVPHEEKIHPGYLTAFLLSDYGLIQFRRLSYGGVVDEIGEAGELFNEILILKPRDNDVERDIGDLVFKAFDRRDIANYLEREAVQLLEKELEEIAK